MSVREHATARGRREQPGAMPHARTAQSTGTARWGFPTVSASAWHSSRFRGPKPLSRGSAYPSRGTVYQHLGTVYPSRGTACQHVGAEYQHLETAYLSRRTARQHFETAYRSRRTARQTLGTARQLARKRLHRTPPPLCFDAPDVATRRVGSRCGGSDLREPEVFDALEDGEDEVSLELLGVLAGRA